MTEYGPINGHAVGIILKDLVRRALYTIRTERFAFEVHEKLGYDGSLNDLVTSADTRAQQIYLRSLREVFPDIGIIAEEENLRIPCTVDGRDLYFTIDPVDGTKALVRGQSHGIGSMIALVDEQRIVSAWVGDVMTQEIYGYRPCSTSVHRIAEFGPVRHLTITHLTNGFRPFVLLHDPLKEYSAWTQRFLASRHVSGYDVMSGSVGTWMARLWKSEVEMAFLPPAFETPWDSTPVIGISEKLGFRFVEVHDDGSLHPVDLLPPREVVRRDHDLAIVHESQIDAFLGSAP